MRTYYAAIAALLAFAIAPAWSGETASEPLRKRGADVVAKIDYATLSTVDADGYPQSRVVSNLHKGNKFPMVRDGETALYFITSKKSNKVQQFRNNPKASAYYLDLSTGTSVLYTGVIEEMNDPALIKVLWADWMKSLYQTSDNPDILVIRLVPTRIKVDRNGSAEQGNL